MIVTGEKSVMFKNKAAKNGASKLLVGALLLTVTGCSTPDWVNPVNWFGDDAEAKAIAAPDSSDAKAEADGEYPKLGDVPDVPGKTVTIEEADSIQDGLKADRDNAQYTDQQLRADTAIKALPSPKPVVAPPPPEPVVAATPGVTAAPSQPVASRTLAAPMAASQPDSAGQFPNAAQAPGRVKLMPNAAPVTTPQQAYARQVPGSNTVVISGTDVADVYQKQLQASSATTTTLPANMQFQSFTPRPLGTSAVAVPQVVRDVYNQPVVLGYGTATGTQNGFSPAAAQGKPDAIVYFGTGSSRIGAAGMKKLRKIAQAQKQTGARVRVVGHASSRTRELPLEQHKLVNFKMSQDRSSAVVRGLIKMGVASSNIILESKSDMAPVTREAMPSDEAKNRRTEIFLVK